MIQYDRLWATMTDRGMTQYKLIKLHGFSAGQNRPDEEKYARFHSYPGDTLPDLKLPDRGHCRIYARRGRASRCTHSQHRFAHSRCSGTQAQREHPAPDPTAVSVPRTPGLQL